MENKFQELLNKTKLHQKFESNASKTFEFDLFASSEWFLSMNDLDSRLNRNVELKSDNVTRDRVEKIEVQSQPISNLNSDINPGHQLKVLFIGDTFKEGEEDLLLKMISAMKLTASEFERIKLDERLSEITDVEENLINPAEAYSNLIDLIFDKKPAFVISLGAVVTNILLGRREKMSGIHGKYFKQSAKNYQFTLMPLFHPDFLIINPNMKRTAWIDLQKVMGTLGKI